MKFCLLLLGFFFLNAPSTAAAGRSCDCRVPDYGGLSDSYKNLLSIVGVSSEQWNVLDNKQRLGFFNIIASIRKVGFSLDGIEVDWDCEKGIQQDRVFFKTSRKLFLQLARLLSHWSSDIGGGREHGDYFVSFRRNVFSKSAQLSFARKRNRLDSDIDIFNPNLQGGYVLGAVLHGIEVLTNKIGASRLGAAFGWSGLTDPCAVSCGDCWQCLNSNRRE